MRGSLSFGDAADSAGGGNLVDLGDFASRASGELGTEGLEAAMEDAVAYSVNGEGRAGASGLSIYFPLSYDGEELSRYRSLTPFPSYGELLAEAFAEASDSSARL